MRIICIGDSLTEGYGVSRLENWVSLLNEKSEHEFINKGISGDTTGGMLSRFQRDVLEEKPKYVIIMGGGNDFIMGNNPGSVRANIMAMVHQAYHGRIIPILGTGLRSDAGTFRSDWAEIADIAFLNEATSAQRDWILQFCQVFKVKHIDFYEKFEIGKYSKSLLFDGLHPSKEGHRILANIAYEALFN